LSERDGQASAACQIQLTQMNRLRESPNLDLLRATAVLFVVVFHLLLFFQKTVLGPFNLRSIGHWGVLLFFVHTSLVLMFSLERSGAGKRLNTLFLGFYGRRCFRVFPLSILIVSVVYALHLPVGHLSRGIFIALHLNRFELVSNLLLVQNLTHSDSIIAPLWSLPFEMQMYLVLPALFLVAKWSRSVLPVLGIWGMSVAMVLGSRHIYRYHLADLVVYVPCFVAGIVAYKLAESRTGNWAFVGYPITIAAITTFFLRGPSPERGWICCLLVGLILPQFREMPENWLRKCCQHVARYSYGIYLTHFICIWLAFVGFAAMPVAVRWAALLATLFAFPVLLYHTIEAPMIRLGNRLVGRRAQRETSSVTSDSTGAKPVLVKL
jgi:peptidoglycan/LPS O-acetylase OafA/YrhL